LKIEFALCENIAERGKMEQRNIRLTDRQTDRQTESEIQFSEWGGVMMIGEVFPLNGIKLYLRTRSKVIKSCTAQKR
jgi:hypothetical protein